MDREEKRTEEWAQQQAEKAGDSSRLGKEAKIGVTAILLLLLVLGGAVVVRLTRANADPRQLASAGSPRADNSGPDGAASNEALFKDFRTRPAAGGGGPTVVPATAAPLMPPKTIDSNLDRWKLASNKADAHSLEPSAPPPTLSDLPKTPSGSRYGRYASDPPSGHELGAPRPLRGRFDDASSAAPDNEKPPRPARADADNLASGRATADGVDPPLRREKEKPRHERSTAPAPPSAPPDTSYSEVSDRPAPVSPVSRYGDNDRRDWDNERRHENNEHRRGDSDFGGSVSDTTRDEQRPHRRSPPSYDSPPPRREDGKYEVQPNDSYWTISEKVYGSAAYFKALYEHNRRNAGDDERLKPGVLISTPPAAELEKSYPDLCPKPSRRETIESRASTVGTRQSYRSGRPYTVSEGDTLFNIARYELGKASRWVEIYELNRDLLGRDFNYLTPGMKLTLPDGEKSESVAEPPNRGYRR